MALGTNHGLYNRNMIGSGWEWIDWWIHLQKVVGPPKKKFLVSIVFSATGGPVYSFFVYVHIRFLLRDKNWGHCWKDFVRKVCRCSQDLTRFAAKELIGLVRYTDCRLQFTSAQILFLPSSLNINTGYDHHNILYVAWFFMIIIACYYRTRAVISRMVKTSRDALCYVNGGINLQCVSPLLWSTTALYTLL